MIDKETLTREKSLPQQNSAPSPANSSFDFQCLRHAFESAVMLGASLLARAAYVTAKSSMASITTAISKESYRAHRFFSSSSKHAKHCVVTELSKNHDKSHAFEKENLAELPQKHKI